MNFIMVDQPGQRSAGALRRAHSYAARVVHARVRRARMAQYERTKKITVVAYEDSGGYYPPVDMPRSNRRDPAIPKIVSGAFEHEPLASFLKSLAPWERPYFSYYVNVVVPYFQAKCNLIIFTDRQPDFVKHMMLFTSMDADLLGASFLTACRHQAMFQSDSRAERLATEYKIQQLQIIRKSIDVDSLVARRAAVARAIMLVVDELNLGDIPMASRHLLGVIDVIQASGGPDVLGLGGLVRYMICASLYGKRLLEKDPILLQRTEVLREDLIRF